MNLAQNYLDTFAWPTENLGPSLDKNGSETKFLKQIIKN